MRRASRLALILCAATVAAILPAQVASAATPIGEYQLQGTLASTGGVGPTLTNIGAGANAFQTDTVNGKSRQVLTFPQHNGLQMSPLGLTPASDLSVVVTFRLDLVSSYRRILDLSNDTSDDGLYANDGKADVFVLGDGPDNQSTGVVFANNTYATVAYVTGGPAVHTNVYVDGALAVEYPGFLPAGDTLRFFRDANPPSVNEDSAGAVSCIRVFSGQLTGAEVGAIGTSPTCSAPAAPAAPATPATPAAPAAPATPAVHKKCKKKHKKRAAGLAKKKHCKKKHKR
jgi:hypothetical protein